MIELLKDIFIGLLYICGILGMGFFALLMFVCIVKLLQGRR